MIRGLALCAGVGGLELGLHLALGTPYRTVAYVEREAYAAATLMARMEDEALDQAPVWDDLTTFSGEAWRGCVDIISAGFPCQPFSVAGQRKGTEDERWLWPDIARIVREMGPRLVFLENVPGLLASHGGFGQVLGDLAETGFDAEWGVFSAGECGAPHRRERVFILADRMDYSPRGKHQGISKETDAGEQRINRESGEGVADADTQRESGLPVREGTQHASPGDSGDGMGNPPSSRHQTRWSKLGIAEGTESARATCPSSCPLPPWPPGPADADGWGRVLNSRPELAPAMAVPSQRKDRQTSEQSVVLYAQTATAESPLRRVAHGMADRVDRLRALGNGVVPIVAAYAFRTLREALRR